jgi:hypothetical protein
MYLDKSRTLLTVMGIAILYSIHGCELESLEGLDVTVCVAYLVAYISYDCHHHHHHHHHTMHQYIDASRLDTLHSFGVHCKDNKNNHILESQHITYSYSVHTDRNTHATHYQYSQRG